MFNFRDDDENCPFWLAAITGATFVLSLALVFVVPIFLLNS